MRLVSSAVFRTHDGSGVFFFLAHPERNLTACAKGRNQLARYLVTGASGFIGRSIAAALLERGETVRGIDNFITGKRVNLAGLEAMEFIDGDLADPVACAPACEGIEVVFHEAALASVPRSVAVPVTTNFN